MYGLENLSLWQDLNSLLYFVSHNILKEEFPVFFINAGLCTIYTYSNFIWGMVLFLFSLKDNVQRLYNDSRVFFQIFYSLYGNVLLKHGISLAKL